MRRDEVDVKEKRAGGTPLLSKICVAFVTLAMCLQLLNGYTFAEETVIASDRPVAAQDADAATGNQSDVDAADDSNQADSGGEQPQGGTDPSVNDDRTAADTQGDPISSSSDANQPAGQGNANAAARPSSSTSTPAAATNTTEGARVWLNEAPAGVHAESSGDTTDFSYTGDYQTFVVPKTGNYRLEAWGADGGATNACAPSYVREAPGGKGGYSWCVGRFEEGETIYVTVGNAGGVWVTGGSNWSHGILAPYNGGGVGAVIEGRSVTSSGGGATHFSTSVAPGATLSSFSGESSRGMVILVAGGGGGSSINLAGTTSYIGTNGGGATAKPGTGAVPGSFGQGAKGGGGGWQGGTGVVNATQSGGGGSGRVGGASKEDCLAEDGSTTEGVFKRPNDNTPYNIIGGTYRKDMDSASGRNVWMANPNPAPAEILSYNRDNNIWYKFESAYPVQRGHARITFLSDGVEEDAFIVTYDANGGVSVPEPQSKQRDVDLILSGVLPTKDPVAGETLTLTYDYADGVTPSSTEDVTQSGNFELRCWSEEQSGGGATYQPGGTYTKNAGATLYAQWKLVNSTASVTLPTPADREGLEFAGWYVDGERVGGAGDTYVPTSSVTLTARWRGPSSGAAYAVLQEDGTLVFFRSESDYTDGPQTGITDIAGNTYNGYLFTGIEFTSAKDSVPWLSQAEDIKKVSSALYAEGEYQVIAPDSSCAYWFDGLQNVTSVNIAGLNTGSVTDMGSMFADCASLEEITLGSNFSFKGSGASVLCALPDPTSPRGQRGVWTREGDATPYEADALADAYDGATMHGTYVLSWTQDVRLPITGGRGSGLAVILAWMAFGAVCVSAIALLHVRRASRERTPRR